MFKLTWSEPPRVHDVVELSHLGVRLLQVRPIHVGFLVFKAIHVGTLQLQFIIELWDLGICRVSHVLSCCAVVYVCVILHKFHTRVQFCATPLASSHHHIQLFSWLSIIVTRHICPYNVVGFIICHESSAIQLLPSSHNLVAGPIHCRSSCPWHKKFPAENGV